MKTNLKIKFFVLNEKQYDLNSLVCHEINDKEITNDDFNAWPGLIQKIAKKNLNTINLIFETDSNQAHLIILFSKVKYLSHNKLASLIKKKSEIKNNNYSLSSDCLRIITDQSYPLISNNYTPKPILLISPSPIDLSNEKLMFSFNLKTNFNFWDGSIWHRTIFVNDLDSFKRDLIDILNNFAFYHGKNIYASSVALEFLELNCRKYKNSYLSNFYSGHSDNIIPFNFHSESLFKKELTERLKKFSNKNWRILVVDDYFDNNLRSHEKDVNTLSKKEILEYLSSKLNNIDLRIDLESLNLKDNHTSKTIELLENQIFDIILLDYYFGDNNEFENRLGIQILSKIKSNSEIYKKINQFGKLWIFFISVYPDALKHHLEAKGMSSISPFWYLSEGADPINTPYLFLSKFLTFLDNYDEKQGYHENNNLINFIDEIISTITELNENNNPTQSIEREKLYYQFVKLKDKHHRVFRRNEFNSIGFSYSNQLLKNIFYNTNSDFWNHLHNLIYLIIFGEELLNEKMWNELGRLKDIAVSLSLEKEANDNISIVLNLLRNYLTLVSRKSRKL